MGKVVYVTERIDYSVISDSISRELMFSVAPAYGKLSKYSKFRELWNNCRIAYDSGGFSFITGKLKNPSPEKTITVYKALGFKKGDILIQLDLPPKPSMCMKERLKLIEKSAQFYHVMKRELGDFVLPVVHGWSEEEIKHSLKLLENPDKLGLGSCFSRTYAHAYLQKVALGTYSVNSTLFKVPFTEILDRLVLAMNMLRDREVFMLGAGNPNSIHLCFYLGAEICDGATWRLAAKMHAIFLPHLGRFSLGYKNVNKPLKDIKLLKMWWRESPFTDKPFKIFLLELKRSDRSGFIARALWNAWVLKVEETIANEYACNPEAYRKYLSKRWRNTPYWRKALQYVTKRTKREYVQEKLTVYLKQNIQSKVAE